MSEADSAILTPDELTAWAKRGSRLDQLDMQGFFGAWVTEAWATRVRSRRGRRIYEAWLLHFSPADDEPRWEPDVQSEVFAPVRFDIPPSGPVLVSDRYIEVGGVPPAQWVERALASLDTPPSASEPPAREVLPDEEFWSAISLLRGRLDETSVERVVQHLRGWDYRRQVSFQEAFDRKLFELDHPDNTVTYPDDPDTVDGESSLMYRCEILATGPKRFAEHVARPRRGVAGRDGQSTPEILYVLEEVSPYGLPRKTVPIETGSNPTHWPDAPPVKGPWQPPEAEVPSPGPFSQRVQLETLGLANTFPGVLYGFVAYATDDNIVRELVGCAMGYTATAVHAEVQPFLQRRITTEQLHIPITLRNQGSGPVRGTPLMELDFHSDPYSPA